MVIVVSEATPVAPLVGEVLTIVKGLAGCGCDWLPLGAEWVSFQAPYQTPAPTVRLSTTATISHGRKRRRAKL
jgi:hypothetical protein